MNILLTSHYQAFGRPLLQVPELDNSHRLKSQELFAAWFPVMSHDNKQEPCLNYANSAALNLWDRCWSEMIGMPSKLTAPKNQQAERKAVLSQAIKKDGIKGYQGIRINSKGRRFVINNARIWTLWDEAGLACGQAATFCNWWYI